MQIFIYCKVTLHVSSVTEPIIRSTNVNVLSEVNKPTHTVSSFQLILVFYTMTCTGGCGYSF